MFFSMACSLIGAVWSARRYFGHGKNFNKRVTYSSGLLFGAETERMELFRVIVEPYHLRPCGAGQYDRHLRKWESWRSCLPSIWERLWKKFWQHPFNDSRSFKNAHTFVFTIPLTCRECVFFQKEKRLRGSASMFARFHTYFIRTLWRTCNLISKLRCETLRVPDKWSSDWFFCEHFLAFLCCLTLPKVKKSAVCANLLR